MLVFARHSLVPATLPAGEPALLLEGSWPTTERADNRWSLDDSIDARFAWIDEAAEELAQTLGAGPPFAPLDEAADRVVSLAWLNALSLRYYLVKLLRVVAFFDEWTANDGIEFHAALPRDDDYVDLLTELAKRRGIRHRLQPNQGAAEIAADHVAVSLRETSPGHIARSMMATVTGRNVAFRSAKGRCFAERKTTLNGPLRRLAAWCNERLDRAIANREGVGSLFRRSNIGPKKNVISAKKTPDPVARVILCGNPRILDPVCAELLSRGCRVAWLYDRLAFGTLLKWRARGVRQLVCQSSLAAGRGRESFSMSALERLRSSNNLPPTRKKTPDPELRKPIERWLDDLATQRGPQQTRLLERIARHFGEFRPTHLVLDEDATPMARAAIAVARSFAVPSIVVQHGAPRVRFGFAPPAADRICVWGEASRDQLVGWGVPAEQIVVTGSCRTGTPARRQQRRAGVPVLPGRIRFYATVPPSDSRPDAVAYHLTTRTHLELVQMACSAVARIPGAELIFKLHPRCRDATVFESAARQTPQLRWRLVRKGDNARLLRDVSCVLNCGSSAGIEAAQCGVPVIELLPAGSHDLLTAADWGLFGSARSLPELEELLAQALDLARPLAVEPDTKRVVARQGHEAAKAVVDAVLETEPSAESAAVSPNRPDKRLQAATA